MGRNNKAVSKIYTHLNWNQGFDRGKIGVSITIPPTLDTYVSKVVNFPMQYFSDPTSCWHARIFQACQFFKKFKSNRLSVLGLGVALVLMGMALLAPLIAPYPPNGIDLNNTLKSPDLIHLFGTDELGRDILSRIIYGARLTLKTVLFVLLISTPIGLVLGVIAGYLGGAWDTILMRITDVFLAFPKVILALAFSAVLGPSLENAIIAIALVSWAPYTRVAKSEAAMHKNADYIKAAKLQGASSAYIMIHHVLPLCVPSTLIRMSLDMSGIILTAAGLGFLGLGAQPPLSEWGMMTAAGREYILNQWWVATIPGIFIFLSSLAFNLMGDGLRDTLDPHHEGPTQ